MAPPIRPHLRTIVSCFNNEGNSLAVCTNDGRIKTWNVSNGNLITELTNSITSKSEKNNLLMNENNNHLSFSFSSIAWKEGNASSSSSSFSASKNEVRNPILVAGTARGEVFAFDSDLGSLKWQISDCHAGKVTSLAFSPSSSNLLYTCGKDGHVCLLNPVNGVVFQKLKLSKKALTAMAVSPDGDKILVGGVDIALFDLSSKKEICRFPGHTTATKCLAFSPAGDFAFSSSTSERQIVIWKCASDDLASPAESAFATLSIEHPAVHLECTAVNTSEGQSIRLLAVSDAGEAYVWTATSAPDLKSHKPIRIKSKIAVKDSLSEGKGFRNQAGKSMEEKIFFAKIVDGGLTVVRGSESRPSFDFLTLDDVEEGQTVKIKIKINQESLFPAAESKQDDVMMIDPACNFKETGGMLPHISVKTEKEKEKEKKRNAAEIMDAEEEKESEGEGEEEENDKNVLSHDLPSLEEQLRSRGIKVEEMEEMERRIVTVREEGEEGEKEEEEEEGRERRGEGGMGRKEILSFLKIDSFKVLLTQALLSDDVEFFDRCFRIKNERLIASTVMKLNSIDAIKLFVQASEMLQSNQRNQISIMLWIKHLLFNHAAYLANSPSLKPIFAEILQTIELNVALLNPLMSLHGRLELISAQIKMKRNKKERRDEGEMVEVAVYEDRSDDEIHAQDAVNGEEDDEEEEDGDEEEEGGNADEDGDEEDTDDGDDDEDEGMDD